MKDSTVEFHELVKGLSIAMRRLYGDIDRPIQEYSLELVEKDYRAALIVFLALVKTVSQKLR